MKTLPAKFSQFKDRVDVGRTFVLKVTDGTTTWYFSDNPINLTDGECYPLLQTSFSIAEGINIGARTWTAPKCELKISNERNIKNADGTFGRPSDYLVGLRYQDATLYLAVGSDTGTIADMATIFDGVVSSSPIYDVNRVSLRLSDRAIHWDKLLPEDLVASAFSSIPSDVRDQYLPLVYGSFTFSWDYYTGLGLAVAFHTDAMNRNFIVSDHVLDAFTELHGLSASLNDPAKYIGGNLNVDDGGRGTADSVSRACTVFLWPNTEEEIGDYLDAPPYPDGIDPAQTNQELYETVDRSILTQDRMVNNYEEGHNLTEVDPVGLVLMAFGDQKFMHDVAGWGAQFKFNYKAGVADWTVKEVELRLYYDNSDDEGPTDIYISDSLAYDNEVRESASWVDIPHTHPHLGTPLYSPPPSGGQDDLAVTGTYTGSGAIHYTVAITQTASPNRFLWSDSKGNSGAGIDCTTSGSPVALSFGISIYFGSTTGHSNSDTWGFDAELELHNQAHALAVMVRGPWEFVQTDPISMDLLRLYEIRINVKFGIRDAASYWAACDGLAFGAWATTRSTNYSEGDLIKDPMQIIHSIFRDVLGEGDSRIDHASFAAAENTSVEARINLHASNRLSVYKIMAQLANQSTAAVYISAAGMVRAVKLNDKSPAIDRTFKWTDIRANSLSVSMTGGVVNHLTYHHKYQQEYKKFRLSHVESDGTSQSTYNGTFQKTAKWPNITDSSATHVAEWLVNTTDGIISKDHVKIRFSSEGFKDYDLDVGDYIRLDETTVSPSISYPGGMWTDKDFKITNIIYKNNQIDFTAVELY